AYRERAVELARNPGQLQEIRRKLAANRLTAPLFNTERYVRHLEAAYEAMYARHEAGLPPDHIHVQPLNRPKAERANETLDRRDPSPQVQNAISLFQQGKLVEALTGFDKTIELEPDYPLAHKYRARVLRQLGRIDDAIGAYDKAIEIRPDDAEAHCDRGNALQFLGRP